MPSAPNFKKTEISDIGIPHQISVDPQSGSASITVEVPSTPGRNEFGPELSLSYGSGGSNSAFGVGWTMNGVMSVSILVKNSYPNYDKEQKYSFGGLELAPLIEEQAGNWVPRSIENSEYKIYYYRPVIDSTFLRLEKWVNKTTLRIHWRIRNRNGHVTDLGKDLAGTTCIFDPAAPDHIFQWMIESHYDNLGNVIKYEYIQENHQSVDLSTSYERHRATTGGDLAQKYIKKIKYGNTVPAFPDTGVTSQHWLFELVMDYGEHGNTAATAYDHVNTWPARHDAFSTYAPGFELRTYRLCRRILMFHNIAELGAGPTLIGSLQLTYQEKADSESVLQKIHYTGYKREAGSNTYQEKSVPPLSFTYSEARMDESFTPASLASVENAPAGIGSFNYKWVDLYGEGLPGIMFEMSESWYYKPNLGNGLLGQQQLISQKPSALFGAYSISDFDGDGNPNLVVLHGREAGYYEYDRDHESWSGYHSFPDIAQVGGMGAHTQLIDLTGDGLADLLTVEPECITWFPSKGKQGFGAPIKISKPLSNGVSQTPTIGSNAALDYFMADMTGDGLPDQVLVRNGRVEYWPNLGYGRFGEGIVMENSPVLTYEFEFDAGRVRLIDLVGTGTADLLYIGNGTITYWINLGGNKFLPAKTIEGLPYIDQYSSLQVIDFLGDGLPCLVWSSPISKGASALHYLKLNQGQRPHLLLEVNNNMGQEVKIKYSFSAKHYLKAKATGEPWLTRLPSHTVVADEIETIDKIANTRFKQRFEYFNGYFDGEDRVFRGFGLVDHYDSDSYQGSPGIPEIEFTDPVCIRTWYHHGIVGSERKRATQYYSGLAAVYADYTLEDSELLNTKEFVNAIKALAGQVIRTEVYSINIEGKRKPHPLEISYSKYLVRRLQPSLKADAVFAVFNSEKLVYTYDEKPVHPRIAHTVNLSIDDYGNTMSTAIFAYGNTDVNAEPEQKLLQLQLSFTYSANFNDADHYAVGIPLEEKNYELNGIVPTSTIFSFDELFSHVDTIVATALPFNGTFTTGPQARLMQWVKNFYWNAALTEMLPAGMTTAQALLHHIETACFNETFLQNTLEGHYQSSLPVTLGYSSHDNLWWCYGDVLHYRPPAEFFVLHSETHFDGGTQEYAYDNYFLNVVGLTDPFGNTISAQLDYHFLAPHRITDINDNISEVFYDPLGIIIYSSVHGEIAGPTGSLVPYGQQPLAAYAPQSPLSFNDVVSNPATFIQGISTFVYYELDRWENATMPVRAIIISREDWVNDGSHASPQSSRTKVDISYLDGFGRKLQEKKLIDPGVAISRDNAGNVITVDGDPVLTPTSQRWLVSGHVVHNNKQNVVRRFEPYFSPSPDYESDNILESFGQSKLTYYDALGREIKNEFPDGTVEKIEITPWQSKKFDRVDAIEGTVYELEREALLDANDPEKLALKKAQLHKNTPVIVHLDALGRAFMTEENNSDGQVKRCRSKLDFLGNPTQITDPRTIVALSFTRDMLGRSIYQTSADGGEKWQLPAPGNQPVHLWDGRGVHKQLDYDLMGRVTAIHVDGALGMDHVTETFVYGESLPQAEATSRNQRGQVIQHYHSSGLFSIQRYNLAGKILDQEHRLVSDYKNIPNWLNSDTIEWMPETFRSNLSYDALGRLKVSSLPDQTTRRYIYLQSGEVGEVILSTGDSVISNHVLLHDVDYNAGGQLTKIILGNGVIRNFYYDPHSFRLIRMTARLPSGVSPGRQYQDIRYTYDAEGNLVFMEDKVQNDASSYISGLTVTSLKEFTYDSFYQTIEARGRTHQALDSRDYAHAPDAPGFIKGTRHISLNNGAAIRRYRQTYQYDLSGNLLLMMHVTQPLPSESAFSWQRNYWVSNSSNRSLPAVDFSGNPINDPESKFDAIGNCLYLPHVSSFDWNYLGQIQKAVIIQRTGQPDDAEYYVYGVDGRRTRKITERLVSGQLEITEKIYLDGCEIKIIRTGPTVSLRRFTSHLTKGDQRIGLLHQWSIDSNHRETDNISQKKIHYHLAENQNACNLELNEAGDVISYEEYFPFGCSSFLAGDQLLDIRLKDYRYSGKERDDATGLYYFGYRYYASWLGRWLSPDPAGAEDALNLYQFVHNNPLNEEDEDGLQSGQSPGGAAGKKAGSATTAPVPWPRIYVVKEGGQEYTRIFNTKAEVDAFARQWLKDHPQGHARVDHTVPEEKESKMIDDKPPTSGDDKGVEAGEPEEEDRLQIVGEGDSPGAGDGVGGQTGSIGSGEGRDSTVAGNGTTGAGPNASGAGTGGSLGNGSGSGSPQGSGVGAGGSGANAGSNPKGGGNGRSGQGNGSGNGGGTGSGFGSRPPGSPVGLRGGREGGTGTEAVDPNAPYSLNGRQGGTGTADMQVGPEGVGSQPGDPNGNPNGSPNGRADGTRERPPELEWWQTALIVAAVITVAVVLTIATAGAAAAVFGTAAAASTTGILAIGATSGFLAGMAGDLTSQSLTLAFQGREVLPNLKWGQAMEAGVVGGALGFFTAGAGAVLSSAARGTLVAANSARAAGTATLAQRALLSTEATFNNSATVRAAIRGTRGALLGGAGGSVGEATRQLVHDGRISDGRAILSSGLQGAAFGAALEGSLGAIGDKLRARTANTGSGGGSAVNGGPSGGASPGSGGTAPKATGTSSQPAQPSQPTVDPMTAKALRMRDTINRLQTVVDSSNERIAQAVQNNERNTLGRYLSPADVNRVLDPNNTMRAAVYGKAVEERVRRAVSIDPILRQEMGAGGYLGRREVIGRGLRRGYADFVGTGTGSLGQIIIDVTTEAGVAEHMRRLYLEKGLIVRYVRPSFLGF